MKIAILLLLAGITGAKSPASKAYPKVQKCHQISRSAQNSWETLNDCARPEFSQQMDAKLFRMLTVPLDMARSLGPLRKCTKDEDASDACFELMDAAGLKREGQISFDQEGKISDLVVF